MEGWVLSDVASKMQLGTKERTEYKISKIQDKAHKDETPTKAHANGAGLQHTKVVLQDKELQQQMKKEKMQFDDHDESERDKGNRHYTMTGSRLFLLLLNP